MSDIIHRIAYSKDDGTAWAAQCKGTPPRPMPEGSLGTKRDSEVTCPACRAQLEYWVSQTRGDYPLPHESIDYMPTNRHGF